jgi:O-antigen/teichoic acid export membrane protein
VRRSLRDLRQSLVSLALRALTLGGKFLVTLAIARFLTPRDLGLFGIMTAGLGFALIGLGLEFYAFAMREVIGVPRDAARMVRDQLVLFLAGSLVALPLCGLAFLLGLIPLELAGWFFALAVLEYLSHEATRVLIALSRPVAANLVLFVRSGAWAYAAFVMLVLAKQPAELSAIFAAWAIGAASSLGLAAFSLRDLAWREAWRQPVDWRWIGAGLRVARPFMVTAVAALGVSYIDRFFIEAYHGVAAVGVYTFFSGIAIAVHTLVHAGVLMLRIPRLVAAHGEPGRLRVELRRLFWATLAAAVAIAILAGLAVHPVLTLVGQAVYGQQIAIFYVLLGAAILLCLADVPVYALYAGQRDLQLLIVNLAGFIVVIIANLLLVPRFGGIGAAWASASGGLALAAAALLMLRLAARFGA